MSELNEIAAALAKAQGDMANPSFDSQNPHFRNRFASLAAVRNAVVPVLAKHGICLTQNIQTCEGSIACTTTLTHASGQQMVFGPFILPASKADAQGFGSAATYARRYTMMAVAGVVGDDDDDAETAVGRGNGKTSVAAAVAEVSGTGDEPPAEYIKAAKRMREALNQGIDGAVQELHTELNRKQEFYVAVSALLTAGERSKWKEVLKRANGH